MKDENLSVQDIAWELFLLSKGKNLGYFMLYSEIKNCKTNNQDVDLDDSFLLD